MSYDKDPLVRRLAHDKLQEVCRDEGAIRITTAFNQVLDMPSRILVRSRYTDIMGSKAHRGSTSSDAVAVMRTVTPPFLLASTGVFEPKLTVH